MFLLCVDRRKRSCYLTGSCRDTKLNENRQFESQWRLISTTGWSLYETCVTSQESPFTWQFNAIFVDIISQIRFFSFGLSGQHLCCHVLSYSWDFTSRSRDTMLFTAQVPPFAWPHCTGGLAHPDDAFITTTSESYKASRLYKHSPLNNLWVILNLSRCRIETEGQRSGHITGIQNMFAAFCRFVLIRRISAPYALFHLRR